MKRKMFAPGEMKVDEKGHIKAAFAQLNVIDSDGDVTVNGAFPRKDVPMSAYGHTSWDGALPVGKGAITEDGDWAVFEGDFFMDTTHGHDAYLTVKGLGELAEYSYGFDTLDAERGTFEGEPATYLKSLDVFEVSPVLKGAGVGTHTLAIKSDTPVSELPYAEHLDRTVSEVKALVERTVDRKALRESEGRDLSTDNIERLNELLVSIKSLLPEPEPAQDNTLMVEIEKARGLGIPI